MVDSPVGADLDDEGRVDEGGVEDVAAPHVAEKHAPVHGCPGAAAVRCSATCRAGVRAQRYGPADLAQSAVLVVAAEDEELRAGQGAGDRADDRLRGVTA
ncbi:hypothetical protein [Streptomyces yangpuensis]|uniref:hypothetical protein n=1 Tax=Streptomyces yangpuensis TaxID=1648182 RepID=UPI00365EF8CB